MRATRRPTDRRTRREPTSQDGWARTRWTLRRAVRAAVGFTRRKSVAERFSKGMEEDGAIYRCGVRPVENAAVISTRYFLV